MSPNKRVSWAGVLQGRPLKRRPVRPIRSPGGKPILALPSRTAKGKSRLVRHLAPGAGVVTTRSHVQWVCTEYGAVNLRGLALHERARALIGIAHPDDRDALSRAWAG